MNHELYSNTYAALISYKPEDWKFSDPKRQSVSVKLSGWVNALYWNAATLGKAKVYVVYDGKTVIHTSFVVRGKEKRMGISKSAPAGHILIIEGVEYIRPY